MNHYDNENLPQPFEGEDEQYFPGKGLKAAMDVALELNMPLMLTGEPGTGKTRFAYHIAQHFKLGDLIRFDAKTTSTANDLFYVYDALQHFHLVHNSPNGNEEIDLLAADIIRFQALGEAIVRAEKEGKRAVLLIDEIDKAPRDFPNDLLNVLEGNRIHFKVPELKNQEFSVAPALKPILIITSNSEKNLPEPFLRRCIFYHIPFPNEEELLAIVQQKLKERNQETLFSREELSAIIAEFNTIRDKLKKRSAKLPATAELISWLIVLGKRNLKATDFRSQDEATQQTFASSLPVVAKSAEAYEVLRKYYQIK